MNDLVSSAAVILSVLFCAVLIIAGFEDICLFVKHVTGRIKAADSGKLPKQERRASVYITESLAVGEEVKDIFELHWMAWVMVPVWVILALPTFGITLAVAAWDWLRLRNIEQGVTNKRVIRKKGIIGRQSDEIQIASIETVELTQSALGRVLGYGNIRVTGRGTSDVVFRTIADPLTAKKKIENVRSS